MDKKVSYKGVELASWVSFLTWDKDGACFGWPSDSEISTDDKYKCWLGYNDGIYLKVARFPALDVEPFTDDSWKDSLVNI